jgi:hypothetical protein
LARTYFKVVQGVPVYSRFNTDNGVFSSVFKFDSTITSPSILFKSSEYFYPNGYNFLIANSEGLFLASSQYQLKSRSNYVNDLELLILDNSLHGENLEITLIPL